jgi:hypothetical protein
MADHTLNLLALTSAPIIRKVEGKNLHEERSELSQNILVVLVLKRDITGALGKG